MIGKTQVLESVYKVRLRTGVILDMGKFALQVTYSNIYISYTIDCHAGCLTTETHAVTNCSIMSRKAPRAKEIKLKILVVLRFRNPAAQDHGPLEKSFVKMHALLENNLL